MKSKPSSVSFLYAASESSADMLYLSGVFVPDSFLAIIVRNKKYAVVNQLEYGRVLRDSNFDKVMLLEAVRPKVAKYLQIPVRDVGPGELMLYFTQFYDAKTVKIPADFPAIFYAKIRDAGYCVEMIEGAFFTERIKKTDFEVAAIRKGNAASAAGIRSAEAILRASTIDGNRIMYAGKPLTSERLRAAIDKTCLSKGAVANHTIVAGGRQACDPHEIGHGLLRPGELIIIDVFPRDQKTGYHGDLSRTFIKGKASPLQRALVLAVQRAQRAAIEKLKEGVSGGVVHGAAQKLFDDAGFVTERRKNCFVGFIHSTGHGLGLEVHEAPRVSKGAPKLKAGQVITIEPGLYYPEIGACRIEDVVLVTKDGYEKLSSLHYKWEIT